MILHYIKTSDFNLSFLFYDSNTELWDFICANRITSGCAKQYTGIFDKAYLFHVLMKSC